MSEAANIRSIIWIASNGMAYSENFDRPKTEFDARIHDTEMLDSSVAMFVTTTEGETRIVKARYGVKIEGSAAEQFRMNMHTLGWDGITINKVTPSNPDHPKP